MAAECDKINNNLTLSQATKVRRYNALFMNAWTAAQENYGAGETAVETATETTSRGPSALKLIVCRAIAVVIVGFVALAVLGNIVSPDSAKDTKVDSSFQAQMATDPEPTPAPVDATPVRKATPVEIRKAIPVEQSQPPKKSQKTIAKK